MAQDEPEYLKARRRAAEQRTRKPGGPRDTGPSPSEREAEQWARETAGTDPQIAPSLRGAGAAILFKPASVSGRAPIILEGVRDRAALADRLDLAERNGHEVLGCYDIAVNRPLTPRRSEGRWVFETGRARIIPKPLSPEQMLRRARAESEAQARRKGADRDRGGRRG